MKKLPFGIDDFPVVISMFPGENPEIVDFRGDRSPNSELTKFLRESFSHQYNNVETNDFY